MTRPQTPRPPPACLAMLDRLSRYIDHDLTPRQRRTIDGHCRDCPRCQRVIAGLQRTVALYRRAGTRAMPRHAKTRARARIARLLRDHSQPAG